MPSNRLFVQALFTTENEIEQHPKRVNQFLEASLHGWEYAMDHPDEIIDLILATYKVNKKREHLHYEAESIRKLMMPDLVQIGHMNPGRWRHIAKTYEKLDLIESNFPLDGFLYDPNPKSDFEALKKTVLVAIVIIILLILGSAILLFFNRKLTIEISQRKKAEDDLRRSEKELQRTLDATADGIWSWNFKSNELYFNPRYYDMLGYEPDEFPANFENWLDLIHPDDREEALAVANDFLKTKPDVYENEFRLRTKSGDYRWARTVAKVVERDESGDAIYMIGNHEDITEKKAAMDALIKEKQRFELAMRSVNDGLWDWNIETNEIYYSPVWKKLLGYEDHEIKNDFSEWERLTDPDDVKASWRILNDVLEGKRESFENEFKMRHKNGHWVDILARANVFFDKNGRGVRVIGTHVDITDRKRLEKKLQQSQKMEAIGTLAGGIAHDFNNILSSILGYTEILMMDHPGDSPSIESLEKIYTSALRAKKLVNQILTFSRQATNKSQLIKIQPIVNEVLKLIRSTIPTTIAINQNIEHECGAIKADPTQIHQIIMNLATNAYHAMEETGGELTVSLQKIELVDQNTLGLDMEPGSYALLKVADTGVGMNKEIIKKIFDPFFTTKEIGKGTGMGLSVVHGIVESTGGSIHVYSEPGKGTEFHVYFPVEDRPVEALDLQVEETIQGGTENILFVDDDDILLTMGKEMLERLGYCVTSYISSSEALEAFQKTPNLFDLVITDMAMPQIAGDQLAAKIKKIRPDIPVLLCTGFSEIMSEEKTLPMGINAFLMKPVEMRELAGKIRNLLDGV